MKPSASGIFNKSLDYIEKVGNKLPHPATLFGIIAILFAVVSAIGSWPGLTAIHPADGSPLLIAWMLPGLPMGPDGPLYLEN